MTAVVEKIARKKGVYENNSDEPQIALQKIPNSSVAVFQNVQLCEEKQKENMRVQVCLYSGNCFPIKYTLLIQNKTIIKIYVKYLNSYGH